MSGIATEAKHPPGMLQAPGGENRRRGLHKTVPCGKLDSSQA